MGHYFTNDQLESKPTRFTFQYHGHELIFNSDSGVFSKTFIDYGSRVLLDAVEIKDAQTLLDLGCGYGTLGITLKALNPQLHVTMVDVNRRAISLAKENITCNNLDNIDVYESNIYENVDGTFDMILSNPPIRAGKKVVHTILEEAYDHLNEGGRLVVVIRKKQGAPSAKAKMEEVFSNCEILKKDKGYYILQSYK